MRPWLHFQQLCFAKSSNIARSEQGPLLETEKRKIGVVTGVRYKIPNCSTLHIFTLLNGPQAQAYNWYTVTVFGRASHTGTTPLAHRADALHTTALLLTAARKLAVEHEALASTGCISAGPGSVNTVPDRVTFSLDLRAATDERLATVAAELQARFADIAEEENCKLQWATDAQSQAVDFDPKAIKCVENAASEVTHGEGPNRGFVRMRSGAGESIAHSMKASLESEQIGFGNLLRVSLTPRRGHDSVYTSRHVPTAMIFVPCRGGVSHHPTEHCTPEDCANGAQVLMGAVLNFDETRTS